MARSLLSLRLVYLALLASASSTMSACIIPVAPNFQDPPSVPDSGLYLSSYSPANGTVVTYTSMPLPLFKVVVSDPNVNATLHVRWLFDYPPATTNTMFLAMPTQISSGPGGQAINQEITQEISCELVKYANGVHQIELVVADREFQDSSTVGPAENKFDSIIDPDNTGHVQYGTWTIVMSCMTPTASPMSSP